MLAAQAISRFAYKKISDGDVILVYGWYGPVAVTEKTGGRLCFLPFRMSWPSASNIITKSSCPFTPAHLWYHEFFGRLGLKAGDFG